MAKRCQKHNYLWAPIIASIVIILAQSFQNYMFAPISAFLLYMLMWLFFLSVVIWSMVYLIKNIKAKKIVAVIPFAIVAVALSLVHFISFDRIVAKFDFMIHYQEMQQVVILVKSGKLRPDYHGRVEMPSEYKDLSYKGVIFVQKDSNVFLIYFVPFGIGEGKWSIGWVYRSDDRQLSEDDLNNMGIGFDYIEKAREHWFYTEESPE